MSELITLIKCLSEQGLDDLMPKKKDNESFTNYFMENISDCKFSTNIIIYNKLLYLNAPRDYSYIWSNLGPYSPDITDEVVQLRELIPKNENVLNHFKNYSKIRYFLTDFKESMTKSNQKITIKYLVELTSHQWLKDYEVDLLRKIKR